MARTVGRNVAAPLLFLNLVMYIIVLIFATWNLDHYINGQTNHPGVAGNGATFYLLLFVILAGMLGGVSSKLAGDSHIRAWRNDSLAVASSSSLIAWAITALAFRLAYKEIHIGGYRGWRLKVLEAFIILLTFTQLMYVVFLHVRMISNKYGPGYRGTAFRDDEPATQEASKGGDVVAPKVQKWVHVESTVEESKALLFLV